MRRRVEPLHGEEPDVRRVERLVIGVWGPPAGLLDAVGRVEGVRVASLAD